MQVGMWAAVVSACRGYVCTYVRIPLSYTIVFVSGTLSQPEHKIKTAPVSSE